LGGATADKFTPAATLSPEHRVIISSTFTTSGGYTLSLWVKPSGYSKFGFRNGAIGNYAAFDLSGAGSVITVSGLTASIAAAANGFYRVEIKDTSASIRVDFWPLDNSYTSGSPSVYSYTGDGTSGILIWGAQLELGSTATAYQRVTTAYDITESGVATVHYLQYDGFNSSMSTAAINFTGTDKMSVFAGVRKNSNAGEGSIAELGAGPGTTGWLGLWHSWGIGADYTLGMRNASGNSIQNYITYSAPINNVLSALYDYAGATLDDELKLRANGAVATKGSAFLGPSPSINFANAPLYFGRRNNATLPFNGKDYGIIVVGKAASAGEITDTELWLSDKTAEVDVAKSISPNIYTRSGDTILDRANSIIERRTV